MPKPASELRPEPANSPSLADLGIGTMRLPRQFLRLPAVIERTGLSKTAVYTTPGFPRPVKLTAVASAWLASEVDAWIDERLAARDASPR
jgi:prophage regulatory protein